MTHVEVDGERKRFRLQAPRPYEAVAMILAISCLLRDLPEIITAATAILGGGR